MPPKALKGALKNKGEKIYTTNQNTGPVTLTPGTLYISSAAGIVKRGVDLQACYQGQHSAGGKRHGYGMYRYANGYMTYEGEYANGQKHGIGKLTFKTGDYYEGRFEHDEIMGQGTRKFANGNVWVGSFVLGDMQGPGVLTFANGDRFEGSMEKNKMHGSATYKFRNGNSYRGDFMDNKMTGQGVMTYRNGDRHKGEWLDGRRHGRGRCSYANGDHYTGTWANDKYHGEGCLVYSSLGIRYEGQFIDGCPSLVPTKLNLFWYESEQEAKARLAPKKLPGKPSEELPLLQNTLSTPLPVPLVIAAQLPGVAQEAEPGSVQPITDKPAGLPSPKSTTPINTTTTVTRQPIMTEKPPAGLIWRTCGMEYGRRVYVTLHHTPPQPATPDRPVGVQLVTTVCEDGSVSLRTLLLPYHLGPALSIHRVQSHPEEPIRCLEVCLSQGQHQLENLVVGELADLTALQCNDGVGYLVASCGWGLSAGYCRISLPDSKAKNPNPTSAAPKK